MIITDNAHVLFPPVYYSSAGYINEIWCPELNFQLNIHQTRILSAINPFNRLSDENTAAYQLPGIYNWRWFSDHEWE